MITVENFGPNNRDRKIGNSLYRICNTDSREGKGKWYIHEVYNSGSEWCLSNAFWNDDLRTVIDKLNGLTEEKQVVSLRSRH